MLPRLARLREGMSRRLASASVLFTLEHLKLRLVSWSASRRAEDAVPTEPGSAGPRPPADWLDRVRRGAPRLLERRPQPPGKPDRLAAGDGEAALLASLPARIWRRRPRPIVEATLAPADSAQPNETAVAGSAEQPPEAVPPLSVAEPVAKEQVTAEDHAGAAAPPPRPFVEADLRTTAAATASRLLADGDERGTPGSAAMDLLGDPASIAEAQGRPLLESSDSGVQAETAVAVGAAAGAGRTLEPEVTVQAATAADLDRASSPASLPGSALFPALPRWPGGPTHARLGAWPDLPHRPWPSRDGELSWSG